MVFCCMATYKVQHIMKTLITLLLLSGVVSASPAPTLWSDSYDAGDGVCWPLTSNCETIQIDCNASFWSQSLNLKARCVTHKELDKRKQNQNGFVVLFAFVVALGALSFVQGFKRT